MLYFLLNQLKFVFTCKDMNNFFTILRYVSDTKESGIVDQHAMSGNGVSFLRTSESWINCNTHRGCGAIKIRRQFHRSIINSVANITYSSQH